MATIQKSLSAKHDENGFARVLIRVSMSKDVKVRYKSDVYVPINRWNENKHRIETSKAIGAEMQLLNDKKRELEAVENVILSVCRVFSKEEVNAQLIGDAVAACTGIDTTTMTRDEIERAIEQSKDGSQSRKSSVYDYAEEYVKAKGFSPLFKRGFYVLMRDVARYEMFVRMTDKERKDFTFNVDKVTKDDIEDFICYLRNEYHLCKEYPETFKTIIKSYPIAIDAPRKKDIEQRGDNRIIILTKRLKSLFTWLYNKGVTKNRPFDGVTIGSERYGTPYYLTIEERNAIADADLSHDKRLETQRDIFVFQCMVGCRVGDLMRLTKTNVSDGILEYVPHKTKDEVQAVKPRVPLTARAKELIAKYEGVDAKGRLFPFISNQKYNDAIKDVLKVCGINRIVPVRNSLTQETEYLNISDLASSHMARRTFVGAAYKKTLDPNLVGKMSGHVEGSRAFARYRSIDDEILKSVINLIE